MLKWCKRHSADLIATGSLIVALFALVESHRAAKPVPQIKDLPVYSIGSPRGETPVSLHLLRFLVSNSGGRAVSLDTISLSRQIDPVMGTVPKDGVVKPIKTVKFFSPASEEPFDALTNRKPNDRILEREGYLLKRKIEPGETIQMGIGLEFADLDLDIDQLLFALDANFSDGTTMPIRGAIDARLRRTGFR